MNQLENMSWWIGLKPTVWRCRHCGDSVFDGCCLNRNGSNAQLFVFKVGSRIWQSDAKSHRILILLLPPPPPSSARACTCIGCTGLFEAGWTEMGVWDWPQVNPFFAPTERMALRSREIRMTQTADIKPFWLEDGATLYNDLCIHGWQLWTSCTIHLSTDPTAQINQAPHQKYPTKKYQKFVHKYRRAC